MGVEKNMSQQKLWCWRRNCDSQDSQVWVVLWIWLCISKKHQTQKICPHRRTNGLWLFPCRESGQRPAWLDAKTHKAPCSANVSYLMARIKHTGTRGCSKCFQISWGFPPHAKLKQPLKVETSPEISGLSAERPQSQWSTHIVLWFEWNYHYDVSNISNTGQCWLVECLPGCWYNIHDFTPLIASLEFYTKHYCHTPYTNSDGDRRWSFSSI